MGWLIYPDTPAIIRDEIARLCTWNNETGRGFPVLISRRGAVWYAAVRAEPTVGRLDTGRDPTGYFETDATGGYTLAAVFLTTSRKGEWGYKDMDETSGPNQAEAPAKLLDLLSPTSAEFALDWRMRCRAHAARSGRRLKSGDVIRLATPLRFSDGAELQTFRIAREKWGRSNRTVFISTENGGRYSVSNIMSRDWTHI